jgi:hypothetical protein
MIKSRIMRWAGHVAPMGDKRVYTRFWRGNLSKRDHFEGPGLDVRIILIWICRKWDGEPGLD